MINYYCEAERNRGKKQDTIYTEYHNASTFLHCLQKLGINKLDDITEEAVLTVFVSPKGELLRSCSYKKNISAVFKACLPLYPEACQKILSFIPALRAMRKNIQYLTTQEANKIREALNDNLSPLTLCDRAIGKLALYTGLRGCDIANMKLSSINWDADIIKIQQQKTGILQELPLNAVVGNAIYDYIVSERPSAESPILFLSQRKPYKGLRNKSIGNVAKRIIKAAGIRQSKGERKGLHILRHHFATALLGNGVPQPVISRVLGHTSPDSTETYLCADFVHLKECTLSIARFSVGLGVFDNE